MDLVMVKGKTGLSVYINKFIKFCQLIPIFVGEGELSGKQVS